MSIISMKNVSYKYPNSTNYVLKNLNCDFRKGNVHVIMGSSGSGKSTLLSLMAGLDNVTEGEITYNNQAINQLDLDVYRQTEVGMIFQAFHLLPLLTVKENVCYPMELTGLNFKEAQERAELVLTSVGIPSELFNRYPSNLSGGEQQRVAIARCVATQSKVILADEPTGNLDNENGKLVLDILKDLAKNRGYTIIIVTHDPATIEHSDVVYVMKNGVLEEKIRED